MTADKQGILDFSQLAHRAAVIDLCDLWLTFCLIV